jgi:hypothetical protein
MSMNGDLRILLLVVLGGVVGIACLTVVALAIYFELRALRLAVARRDAVLAERAHALGTAPGAEPGERPQSPPPVSDIKATMVALAEEMRLLREPIAMVASWIGAFKSSEEPRSAEESARKEVPPIESSEPPAPNDDSSIPPEPDDDDSGSSGPTLQ